MARDADTEVIVVGAGPVGLTLGLALGRHGVRTIVVERNLDVGILPKMDLTNPRSMEIFRRLGVADQIRAAGWPLDARFDVYLGPSLTEPPYAVLDYPSITEMKGQIDDCQDGSQPREAYERISQYNLEALLRREAGALPGVEIRFGCELTSFEQEAAGVTARVRTDGEERALTAQYLVGCDGGNSAVRKRLDIACAGKSAVSRMYMVFFRAPDLLAKARLPPFRHYMIAGARHGALIAQDDLKRWAAHIMIRPDTDAAVLDPAAEVRALLGLDLEIEVLYAGAWTPHLLVADRYGEGRVFLAGDAVHQYVPTGGFGMNTGVADAENLAWKLAAMLRGWGGPDLLASYEDERRPVALRNCRASEYAAMGGGAWRSLAAPAVRGSGPQAQAARRRLAAAFNTYQRRSHEQRGIELGYRYTNSAVCAHAPGWLPDPDSPVYQPSAAPGTRLPHAWIEPGVSVHDRAGPDLTLLGLGARDEDMDAFRAAARRQGAPLEVLRIDGRPDLVRLYGARLFLLRPDLHVGWRGDAATEADEALAICTGRPLGRLAAAPTQRLGETASA